MWRVKKIDPPQGRVCPHDFFHEGRQNQPIKSTLRVEPKIKTKKGLQFIGPSVINNSYACEN
jgi:hypothetical protein